MYETSEYEPSTKTFHNQEDDITYSWGNLKVVGDFHPKMRKVSSLRQKGAEIKLIITMYSGTYTKLKDLLPVLDDGTLLEELKNATTTTDMNVSLVKSEMGDKDRVDAVTLANSLGVGIKAANRTCKVTTSMGIRSMINPSLTKRYKTNDR
jgi:hypothetical protein